MNTQVFRLPDLGEGLTEAALVQWLVAVGDTIGIDQPIAEVETAKSIVELPSPFAGVVAKLHGSQGDALLTGEPVIEVEGGDAGVREDPEGSGSGNVLIGYGTNSGPAKGRRRRASGAGRAGGGSAAGDSAGVAADAAAGSAAAAPAALEATRRTVAVRSPIVRRLARELGVDPRSVPATGSDGAVTRTDVLRAAHLLKPAEGSGEPGSAEVESQLESVPASPAVPHDSPLPIARVERFSPLRRVVSDKLTRSRAEIPEATVWVDVDLTELWELRSRMAQPGERAPSLTAILARYTLIALQQFPILAGRLTATGDAIEIYEGVNLGIAVDTSRGLMVPVLPRADELTVGVLDSELRAISALAREGRTPPERLRDSTFTLNNYGGLGVDGSAAIINHPEVAMLGIGRVLERAWVVDGRIEPRRIAQLSLVFDHRVCDGGYAAGFLRAVTDLLEHPLRAYPRL